MIKDELTRKIGKEAGVTKVVAETALVSFMNAIAGALREKGGKLTLAGFGTFSKVHRAARKGRNPQTGKAMTIKACSVIKFKPGRRLKDAIAKRKGQIWD